MLRDFSSTGIGKRWSYSPVMTTLISSKRTKSRRCKCKNSLSATRAQPLKRISRFTLTRSRSRAAFKAVRPLCIHCFGRLLAPPPGDPGTLPCLALPCSSLLCPALLSPPPPRHSSFEAPLSGRCRRTLICLSRSDHGLDDQQVRDPAQPSHKPVARLEVAEGHYQRRQPYAQSYGCKG